ncbi:TPA: hypothetical protein I7272_24085 [Vibrio parahaemolyticus]|uniref:hypothetical protein n=1 Tax=Vibrio parahaemolyticus TaxID=670 RepID=UPI0011242C04|nr:hypothetical protein [Vibrio parahaemolyticus]EIC2576077.1 hypothetical protein [Vibrio parahaemolyticus]EID0036412.1 hypothetical protein [Vibrio parahaemolyticus]ELB2167956.1 hypothetical protein [Vibrio parahaemolyticus]MBM4914662.1 hypothetical protein [Vibrio parahaemolyticus]TOQ39397.1 hypothetical protein CGG95_24435 [Vibrio parahaemolyticus]
MKQHYLNSSFRERLIEHSLISELLKISWKNGSCSIEIAKPEVDNQGYDLIMEDLGAIRHVQLKTSHIGSSTTRQKIHVALANKPSGCVVWVYFNETTLDLGPFLYFGDRPNKKLPNINDFPIAKHTKGNADGIKNERLSIRVVSKSKFVVLETMEELYEALFKIV